MKISEEGIPDRVKVEHEAFDRSFALQKFDVGEGFRLAVGAEDFNGLVVWIDQPAKLGAVCDPLAHLPADDDWQAV